MTRNQQLGIGCNLLLIDGMNLIFRSYYTTGDLETSYAEPTGIIYGFLKSLSTTTEKYTPQSIVVCWEGKDSNAYRREIYSGYKGDRKEKGKDIDWDDIYQQKGVIKDFLVELGISTVAVPYKEADDVIAGFCFAYPNKKIVINSSDRDLLQLMTPNVIWYNGKVEINIKNFYSKVGVSLERFVDYKVMVGDDSDCIPGIKGIGPKTAKGLLNKISLDQCMENYTEKSALPRTKNLFVPGAEEIIERNRNLMDLGLNPIQRGQILGCIESSELDECSCMEMLEDWEIWSILDDWEKFITGFRNCNLKGVLNGK